MAQPPSPLRQASSIAVIPKAVIPQLGTSQNLACTCFILQQFSSNVQTLMLDYTRRIQSEAPIYA